MTVLDDRATAGPASQWAAEVDFAADVARSAGAILMDRYERLERIHHKSARDVVTEADHLSEAHIIESIRARFPADAILAEESGAHEGRPRPVPAQPSAPDTEPQRSAARTWVIDPLDGTVNYANGLPVFCVSIGFVVDGRPAAGVVLDPTRDELFAATDDGPATLNDRPIVASPKPKLSDYVISLSLSGRSVASRARAIRREIRISRSMGSAALALAYVGNGRFDAFVQETSMSAWDVAAAGLIAERGGAMVTAFDGSSWFDSSRPVRGVGIVAAPSRHHARLLALSRTEPGR
ncbi:MAG: inositol monophosphatase family protein [Chloroflexota bacterium]